MRLFEAKNVVKKSETAESPHICSLLLESSKERLSTGEFTQQINQTLSFQMVDNSSDILNVEIRTPDKEIIAFGKIDITDAFSGFPINQWFDLEAKTELDGTPKIHLEIETFFVDENSESETEEESESDSVSYNQPQQFDSDSLSGFSNIVQSTSRPSFEPVKPIEVPEYEYYYVEEEEEYTEEVEGNQETTDIPLSNKANINSLSVNVDPKSIQVKRKVIAPTSLQKRRVSKVSSTKRTPQTLSTSVRKTPSPRPPSIKIGKDNSSEDETPTFKETTIHSEEETKDENKTEEIEQTTETKEQNETNENKEINETKESNETDENKETNENIKDKKEEIPKEPKSENNANNDNDNTEQQEIPDDRKKQIIKPRRRSKVEELYDRTKNTDITKKKSQEFYKLELSTSGEQLQIQNDHKEYPSNETRKRTKKIGIFSASSSEESTPSKPKKQDKKGRRFSSGSESSEEPQVNRIKVVSRKRSPESSYASQKETPKLQEETSTNQSEENPTKKQQTPDKDEKPSKPSKHTKKTQKVQEQDDDLPTNEEKPIKLKKTHKKESNESIQKEKESRKEPEPIDEAYSLSSNKSKRTLYQPHKVVFTKKDIQKCEKTITLKKKRLKRIRMQIKEQSQYLDKQLLSMNMDVKKETNITEMKVLLERNATLISQAEKEMKQNKELSMLTRTRLMKALEETSTALGSLA